MRLFETPSFLFVDKAPGALSVPSRLGAKDPRPCALAEWSQQLGTRLWAVHRLDAEVGGILCFAKTAEAHRAASLWFERREVGKRYEAVTEGATSPPEGTRRWESRLARGKRRAYEAPFGKEAVTEATSLGPAPDLADGLWLWQIIPLTGRPHQIRYELAKQGFPVWGDALYGSRRPFPLPGAIALRAVRLDFTRCPGREAFGLPETLEAPGGTSYLRVASPAILA